MPDGGGICVQDQCVINPFTCASAVPSTEGIGGRLCDGLIGVGMVFFERAALLLTSVLLAGCGESPPAPVLEMPVDSLAPSVAVQIGLSADDTLAVPGDTLYLDLSAVDDYQVAWVGYQLGLPAEGRDSFPASGLAGTAHVALPVTRTWIGDPVIIGFAYDTAGHMQSGICDTVHVRDLTRRPSRVIPFTDATTAGGAVYDAARGLLYLSQPDSDRVAVVDVSTGSYGPYISVGRHPMGLDLTLSAESLVVAASQSAAIDIIDLLTDPPQVTAVPLDYDTLLVGGPSQVALASNGFAIVTFGHYGEGRRGLVVSLDLATRTQRVRTEAGRSGIIIPPTPLLRTVDRSAVLLRLDPITTNPGCQLYVAVSDTFGPISECVPSGEASSVDSLGFLFLLGNRLYDRDLVPLGTLDERDYGDGLYGSPASAIAPGGNSAFLAIPDGYVKVRISDDSVLERVRVPIEVRQLMVLPDGKMLVARTDHSGMWSDSNKIAFIDVSGQ